MSHCGKLRQNVTSRFQCRFGSPFGLHKRPEAGATNYDSIPGLVARRSQCWPTTNSMDKDRLTIEPPLYLIGKMYSCWRCGTKMPVVTILAPKVEDTDGEICILSEITELPDAVLAYIQERVPRSNSHFQKRLSRSTSPIRAPNAEYCRAISIFIPSPELRFSRRIRTRRHLSM